MQKAMDEKDKNRIKKFIAIADDVKKSRFYRETKSVGFNLNFEAGKGLEQSTSGYDEEDFRSMLLDLRKVIAKKEGVKFTEICDLISTNTKDVATANSVRTCKELYLKEDTSVKMIIDGVPENNSAMRDKWINGKYFHSDKEAELQAVGIGRELHKYNFVTAMTGLISLVSVLSREAQAFLREIDGN